MDSTLKHQVFKNLLSLLLLQLRVHQHPLLPKERNMRCAKTGKKKEVASMEINAYLLMVHMNCLKKKLSLLLKLKYLLKNLILFQHSLKKLHLRLRTLK